MGPPGSLQVFKVFLPHFLPDFPCAASVGGPCPSAWPAGPLFCRPFPRSAPATRIRTLPEVQGYCYCSAMRIPPVLVPVHSCDPVVTTPLQAGVFLSPRDPNPRGGVQPVRLLSFQRSLFRHGMQSTNLAACQTLARPENWLLFSLLFSPTHSVSFFLIIMIAPFGIC